MYTWYYTLSEDGLLVIARTPEFGIREAENVGVRGLSEEDLSS